MLDFVLALALLPPALVLVALAALAVKLTSAGPAFYTQTRVGRNGRRFVLFKLRTMRNRCEAQSGPSWSPAGDSRIIPVGRFLRATHLDELPQLWNVLRGEMSLVGPRPERPEIIKAFSLDRLVPRYSERLSVKPGITGLAQLRLPPDTDVESVQHKVALDLYYVENVGLWLDLMILLGTLRSAVRRTPRAPAPVPAASEPKDAVGTVVPATAEECRANQQPTPDAPSGKWQMSLAFLLTAPSVPLPRPAADSRAPVRAWFRSVVVPALDEFAAELRRHGRRVRVSASHPEEAGLRVWNSSGERELDLKFRVRGAPAGLRAYARELVRDGRRDFVHEHTLDRPLAELTGADVLALAVARYQAALALDGA